MTPMYSAAELITILSAIGLLIGGLGAVIVNVIVALKTNAKLDAVNTKADVIGVHVNGAAAAAAAKMAALEDKVRMLLEALADKKLDAALLAQAAATVPIVAPIAATVEVKPPGSIADTAQAESLRHIEANTAATAVNTTPKE